MAVRSRLETGRLRVAGRRCPNLLYEAGLYRYDDASNGRGSETSLSESNHALDALHYLITRVDQRRMAKDRRPAPPADGAGPPESPERKEDWRSAWGNEKLWTRLTRGDLSSAFFRVFRVFRGDPALGANIVRRRGSQSYPLEGPIITTT